MEYSRMAMSIPESKIRAMMERAMAMDDVISFSVGDPDFPSPDCVIEAAKKSLDEKRTHYTQGAGIPELRETYAAYLSEQIGIHYGPENVMVTVGGMNSLYLEIMAITNPGDEVLIAAPYFGNYYEMVTMLGCKPVPVDVLEKDEFQLRIPALEKALTPKSKVLMINSPCNPTGSILRQETLEEIAAFAKEHDLWVLSDEVYRHILFDGEEFHSIASIPGMAERTVIVDSCSKTFAMTGFRIGFAAGPVQMIRLITKLMEGINSCASSTGQYAALAAFREGLPYMKKVMLPEYQRRRDYLFSHLNAMHGISCILPKGAFYIFTNISGTGMDATAFAEALLEEAHVAVVPGSNFGSSDGDAYVRISYATSMENIEEGCRRMEKFCERFAGQAKSA